MVIHLTPFGINKPTKPIRPAKLTAAPARIEERTINTSLIFFVFIPKDEASSSPRDSTSRSFEKLRVIIEDTTINATAGINLAIETEEKPPTLKSPLMAVSFGYRVRSNTNG